MNRISFVVLKAMKEMLFNESEQRRVPGTPQTSLSTVFIQTSTESTSKVN